MHRSNGRGRRNGGVALVQRFVIIIDFDPLCSKLGNLLVNAGPTADVWDNIFECSMVDHLRMNNLGDRNNLAVEWRGDRDNITQMGGLSDPPL